MRKYKKLALLLLVLISGLYLGVRFYVLLKPPSVSFPLTLKWQVDLGNSTYERPAYQEGLLLFPASGSISSAWYGLEATTGQVVWRQSIGRNSFLRCLTSDYLVVSGPASLMVLNPRNGKIIWPGEELSRVATCSDTAVFTVGNRGFVEALDLSTGEYLWRGVTPEQSFIGLVYNFETGELIADGAVIVNPNSGQLLRFFDPPFIGYAPDDQGRGDMDLIDQGQLFIGGNVRDAKTGQVLHIEERYGGFAAPTVTEDIIYIADSTENGYVEGVVALDRATYAVKWKYQPKHKLPGLLLITLSPVAIFDGIGYVIFGDATLRAFDLETGQEIGYWQPQGLDLLFWPGCTLPIPRLPNPFDCVHSSGVGMATSDDNLFVSFGDGRLYAFGKAE